VSAGGYPRVAAIAIAAAAAFVMIACGGNRPTGPTPPPGGGGNQNPPANNQPVIESIAIRNARPRVPADFADVSDTIEASAQVKDDETPIAQLQFQWTATNGTFTGTGPTVTWTPDASAVTPVDVTITLRLVERYGHAGGPLNWEHTVSRTASIRLHHSARELGEMSRRFLIEFSKPQTNKDWQDIMRDFKAAACPRPSEIDAEKQQVIDHYMNFTMHEYRIGEPVVSLSFGGLCPPVQGDRLPADACVSAPTYWDSTDRRSGLRRVTTGIDHLTASYSTMDARWWLCSSRFESPNTFGHSIYWR
jgi:hypothetical protein